MIRLHNLGTSKLIWLNRIGFFHFLLQWNFSTFSTFWEIFISVPHFFIHFLTFFCSTVVLLLRHSRGLYTPLRLDIVDVTQRDGIHPFRTHFHNTRTTGGLSSLHLELFSSRKRALEQLWKLSSCQRYQCCAIVGLIGRNDDYQDDGWLRWSFESTNQQEKWWQEKRASNHVEWIGRLEWWTWLNCMNNLWIWFDWIFILLELIKNDFSKYV